MALSRGDADLVEHRNDRIEPAKIIGGEREPDEQRHPVLQIPHPNLVAEAQGEQQDTDAYDDVGPDQAQDGIQNRGVEMHGLHDAAGEQHESEHHQRGQDDDGDVCEKIDAERATGGRQCTESLVTAQQNGGEPADAHARDQRTGLDQNVPREQDVEEGLQV